MAYGACNVTFDWSIALETLPALLSALRITAFATVLGMLAAAVLGLVWAIARRSPKRMVSSLAGLAVEFIRSTPLLIQIYFLFYVLPEIGIVMSPMFTGVIALGLHYSAYLSEVYRAGVEGVPKGQWEAARALNLGRLETWRLVILPQALPPVVPAMGNYLIAMFKDTPMLSAITVLELLQTAKVIGAERFRYLEPLTLVGLLFLLLSLGASLLVRWGEGYLGKAQAR
ncbi:MAG: ectoine/hydroxyectoine ABC transporter permease subunit EhuD [Candidatus Hydrogenedentes bacterium]|nr:ectoine/hydroxyectoine ABC transporter permease subunit EhuD [Candidatus Hydrogenedentota bacterium]